MPLTLVTGPANAAKAGEVLGGLRAALDRDPILLVPTFGDVEHAQRELAERGAVFGARVLRFRWLFQEIARRAGYGERVASDVQRELIVEDAVRRAGLSVLAESAGQPGFVQAAVRFFAELGRSMVEPARFTRALRDWSGDGPRRAYAEEVAALYRGYRAGLDDSGVVDPELFAWRALDALRTDPDAWGGSPLFVYGFDDFTPLELDALETIAGRCGADVTVSLPFESGRQAFRATAGIRQELLARGATELTLEPVDEHYAPGSRAALHHLERRLFEDPGEPGGSGLAFEQACSNADLTPLRRSRSTARAASAPRWSSPRPASSSCCVRGSSPATSPSSSVVRACTRRCSSRCSALTGSPSRSIAGSPSATPVSGAACWR